MVMGRKTISLSIAALSLVGLLATVESAPPPELLQGGSPEELRQRIEERRRNEAQSGSPQNARQPDSRYVRGVGSPQGSEQPYLRGRAETVKTPIVRDEPGAPRQFQEQYQKRLQRSGSEAGIGQSSPDRPSALSQWPPDRSRSGNQSEQDSGGASQQLQQRGIEKKDIRRGMVINNRELPDVSSQGESGKRNSYTDQQREQLRQRFEQLKRQGERGQRPSDTQIGQEGQGQAGATQSQGTESRRNPNVDVRQRLELGKKGQQGQNESKSGGQEEVMPTPPQGRGEQTGRLSREELKQRLLEKRQGQNQSQSGGQQQVTPTPRVGSEEGPGRLSREELKQKLLEKRQGQSNLGKQAGATPGAGTGEQGAQQSTREQMRQRLEELRQKKQQGEGSVGHLRPTPKGEALQQTPGAGTADLREKLKQEKLARQQLSNEQREQLRNLYQQSKDKKLSELAQQLRSREGQAGRDPEAFKAQLAELRKAHAEERARLIGANIEERKAQFIENRLQRQRFTAEDLRKRFGQVQARPRIELDREQLQRLNRGEVPPSLRPRYYEGFVHRPLDLEWRHRHDRWFCPPPPPRHGFGVDLVGFHWDYWDGRHRYDHHWAINIFISVGHTRYDGFDGVIVGGRYFCYGWGWIDGCIDYGDCRVWVPGFWAPYTVTECGECEVWVPPVYDWVWTGCCWEQVLVSGGYFVRQPSGCHTVTRWRWVPGHFEYYRC